MAGSGGFSEPAARRPSQEVGSVQLLANTSRATGEQSSSGGRQLVSPEGGATYAAVVVSAAQAATAAQQQPSGPLMPTAKCPARPNPSSPTTRHKGACHLTCPGQ